MSGDRSAGDESTVLEALQRLNFGATEARVLVGLHTLGSATAREVSRVTDVSRPQVYNAVEALERRGLVDSQQATPKQFLPVSPEETEALLTRSFTDDIDLVTDYLEDVARQREDPTEEREDIWTVRGQEAISERIVQLLEDATDRVVFGVRDERLLTPGIVQALRERADAGVDVLVVTTATEAVGERFSPDDGVSVVEPSQPMLDRDRDHTGRMLLVDRQTVLHSVLGDEDLPGLTRETAFWSSGSGFASTLTAMLEHLLEDRPA